jgi:hypothetical protein
MSKTKTSYSSMKKMVDAGILQQSQLDEAISIGLVSMPRTGKLDFAPTEVQNAWNTFVEVVHSNGNLIEWNDSLSELGDSISEVSLNCKK